MKKEDKIKEMIKSKEILSNIFNKSQSDWDCSWCRQLTKTIGSLNLAIQKLKDSNKFREINKLFNKK